MMVRTMNDVQVAPAQAQAKARSKSETKTMPKQTMRPNETENATTIMKIESKYPTDRKIIM